MNVRLRATVAITTLVVAGTVILFAVTLARQETIRRSQSRQTCIAEITAEFQFAIADALAAPPAPNLERERAVLEMELAARRLRHLSQTC